VVTMRAAEPEKHYVVGRLSQSLPQIIASYFNGFSFPGPIELLKMERFQHQPKVEGFISKSRITFLEKALSERVMQTKPVFPTFGRGKLIDGNQIQAFVTTIKIY